MVLVGCRDRTHNAERQCRISWDRDLDGNDPAVTHQGVNALKAQAPCIGITESAGTAAVVGSSSTMAPSRWNASMAWVACRKVKIGDSKRRKNKFLAEHPWCCFCGGSEKAITEDHQPARSLFDGRGWPEG